MRTGSFQFGIRWLFAAAFQVGLAMAAWNAFSSWYSHGAPYVALAMVAASLAASWCFTLWNSVDEHSVPMRINAVWVASAFMPATVSLAGLSWLSQMIPDGWPDFSPALAALAALGFVLLSGLALRSVASRIDFAIQAWQAFCLAVIQFGLAVTCVVSMSIVWELW
jgi:hypothetical protein